MTRDYGVRYGAVGCRPLRSPNAASSSALSWTTSTSSTRADLAICRAFDGLAVVGAGLTFPRIRADSARSRHSWNLRARARDSPAPRPGSALRSTRDWPDRLFGRRWPRFRARDQEQCLRGRRAHDGEFGLVAPAGPRATVGERRVIAVQSDPVTLLGLSQSPGCGSWGAGDGCEPGRCVCRWGRTGGDLGVVTCRLADEWCSAFVCGDRC